MKEQEKQAEVALEYLNQLAGRRFKPLKHNTSLIVSRLKEGYSLEDIQLVIYLKTIEWKNNPMMSPYLCPSTLFRASNFEKYYNHALVVKQNPDKYQKHYESINQQETRSRQSLFDDIDAFFAE